MVYNLTPTQEKAVRWLVEKTESGDLTDGDVLYSFSTAGGTAVQSSKANVELPEFFSKSTFEILDKQELVHLRLGSNGGYHVALTGMAYEAVEDNFEDEPEPSSDAQPVFNLHGDLQGDNARINIQCKDQSINVVNKNKQQLFTDLRQTVKSGVEDEAEKQDLLDSIKNMEQADSKSSYLKAYGFFISLVAGHVNLLEPFIGALWQLYQNL
jgi:hypothetical protein